MNKWGLRAKLLVSHVGVAVSALLTIILLVNLVMNFSFNRYQESQRQGEANALIEELSASYNVSVHEWDEGTLMLLSHQAMLREYSVQLYDKQYHLLWNTRQMGMSMNSGMTANETNETLGDNGSIRKAIYKDGQQIGTVVIQGIGESSQNLNRQFLRMFNTLLWAALLVVIAGACLFSVMLAKGISRPLLQIKEIATRMIAGDLSSRIVLSGHAPGAEVEEVGLALNHLADALEQQDKLRKTLTADVAHELRTPLTTIQSHLEAFQDGIWEPTPDKLQICHDQVLRLVQLISDLENLAAVENPILQLHKENVCLNEIVHQSLHTISGLYKDKGIIVNVAESEAVYITGDYSRLIQVFDNLLSNAYKYTNSGSIQVAVSRKGTEAQVSIKDTGTGIAPEELPLIFERFYRGEKSRNRKTGGSGIGLAIVKAVVEVHGGDITVKSELNQGTEVMVSFPGN